MSPLSRYPRDATIHFYDSQRWGCCLGVFRGHPPGRHVHRPRSTGGSLSMGSCSVRFGSFSAPGHTVPSGYAATIRYGVIVLSIAYSTHNNFRATATIARFPPDRLAIRS
jgi:hypothetical protein